MKNLLRRLTALLCALALCLTFASALSVEDAVKLLEENYVDELPAAVYEATTLDELWAALGDPYTYYMDAVKYEEFNAGVEGESTVTGIGAVIEYTADGILIASVLAGSGAEDAGLQGGDLIVAIDGVTCVPASDAHRGLIVGEEGTPVTLTVRHADGTTRDYSIVRKTFEIHNTSVRVEDGIGIFDCDTFGSTTIGYFLGGICEHLDNVDSWIIDLRGNTGGLADAAVGTLGAFTGRGGKLIFRRGSGETIRTGSLVGDLTDKPVIVLVNGYSASASEILAGGIRAEQAGIVIGSRTYGKGSAQIVIDKESRPDLFDGDSIKITAYRFYCVDGNTTDRIGVLPTLFVEDAYTYDVAKLLRGKAPASGEYLILTLNGSVFYLDPAAAVADGFVDALNELLSALPPDASITRVTSGGSEAVSAAQALALYSDASVMRRGFSDVADCPYAAAIDTLGVYGIVRGDGAGRFLPDDTLTRAQLCAMLAQALNVTSKASGVFADVPDGRWYAGDVNAMAALGFVSGTGNGRFSPDDTLTQEQFVTIMGRLTRFLNYHADDYALSLDDSVLASSQLSALASWARPGASVMSGYSSGLLYTGLSNISPSAPVTRAQAAATLCNVLKTLHILSY